MPDRTLIERLDALSRVPFEGEAFRHMGPGYGPLDAEGARIHGGRWNPPNSFPVYPGTSTATACVWPA